MIDYAFPYASKRMPVLAENVVATSQPLAAQAGLSMLQRGGNAVDAAIATAISLAVVEPPSNGIGSDAFCILWDGQHVIGLNGSGRSPAGTDCARFAGHHEMPRTGWDSVTVPGAVSTWWALSHRFGKLPFGTLFEPAVRYASDGFLVAPITAAKWKRDAGRLKDYARFAETFLPNGRAPLAGEVFRCPDQARTLELIAETGTKAFYEGSLADAMVCEAKKSGAALSDADLANHRCEWTGTVSKMLGDVELHEIPPNGQGLAALIAIGILSETALADCDVDSPDAFHLQIEAVKLAFADTARYLADSAWMSVPVDALLDRNYLQQRASEIDMRRAGDPDYGLPSQGDTVCLATADQSGVMVSFIQSNFEGFGSGIVIPGTGISLQNRAAGFALERGHDNAVAPGKRPAHTIIPALVSRGGHPVMSFGVMGGSMQPQGHVQLVVRVFLHGQNPQAASDAPRWRVGGGRAVSFEEGFDQTVLDELRRRGHAVGEQSHGRSSHFGGAQVVYCLDRGYLAASDHRKDGHAVGF